MIEVIYKDEKQEVNDGETGWNLPKNIRQIGLAGENYRIYIEDYVYTFLHRAAQAKCQQEEDSGILAVFLGENRWQSGTGYTFIRGALLADAGEITEEHIEITQNMWQKIHEEQEKYFEGQEIVGWFLARQSLPMVVSELIGKVHRNQFGGEKILMLMDTAEQEEAFFRYENNFLVRQSGYYIYYEKNTQMQNYMLEKNPEIQEESQETVQDDAVRAFRSLIQKKKKEEPEETEEKTSVFSYAATACIVLALAVVGVRFYRNYQVGQNIEGETRTASADIMQETEITQIPAASVQQVTPTSWAELTESPKITPTAEPTLIPTVTISAEEAQIYKEESDTRKAQRRIQQKKQNKEESTGQDNSGQASSDQDSETTSAMQTRGSYTIRPGDTLYQISIENYGTMDKVADICRANGISENEIIYPGQIIVLP
jgi:nucleoid-associated protein YgaU|nr:LysM peptidoglycan-binding domain-containing protein [uncultured Blautia sp.]